MDHRERLKALLLRRSLKLGDFTLAGGERSSYYVDARATTMTAEGQACIGRLALRGIREMGLRPGAVGGMTLGADPIAYAIAHRSWEEGEPIDAFTVRKEVKGHGARRRVEGRDLRGVDVVVVEDVVTTGGSALEAARAAEEEGARVVGFLALVDREAGGAARIRASGRPFLALFRASELLEAARRGGGPSPGAGGA